MDMFNTQKSQNQKKPSKNYKKRLTYEQVKLLERSFTSNNKLQPERKHQLSLQLGIPPRQVAIWYQNKRARSRTQSLELDYSALQLSLENALAEKQQLKREVERLNGELAKAQEMLFALNVQTTTTTTTTASSCARPVICPSLSCSDQEGMSSARSTIVHDLDVELEELYACLIGSDGLISWD
ncbi:homeobox-leucine zipper protein ATHB-52 [Ziziphus jujuba]|uniref:Homeobox-leucine zipper protein n=1 Tax=Ziziphus jujuba TaxID=326968 RepID=A0A6P4AMH4_ZIZJJ|nr:homeobox-leucine zipper protein ATHB-52 [Ziziphus jujuba]